MYKSDVNRERSQTWALHNFEPCYVSFIKAIFFCYFSGIKGTFQIKNTNELN